MLNNLPSAYRLRAVNRRSEGVNIEALTTELQAISARVRSTYESYRASAAAALVPDLQRYWEIVGVLQDAGDDRYYTVSDQLVGDISEEFYAELHS